MIDLEIRQDIEKYKLNRKIRLKTQKSNQPNQSAVAMYMDDGG